MRIRFLILVMFFSCAAYAQDNPLKKDLPPILIKPESYKYETMAAREVMRDALNRVGDECRKEFSDGILSPDCAVSIGTQMEQRVEDKWKDSIDDFGVLYLSPKMKKSLVQLRRDGMKLSGRFYEDPKPFVFPQDASKAPAENPLRQNMKKAQ